MRRLSLHASALNDDEYKLYTNSIADLALPASGTLVPAHARDDAFYEDIAINVREVRAWLRGRYPDVPVASIDELLKFFSPALAQGEMLSGGQFFAVLRLVIHVQHGKEVDRALAFVQAHPTSPAGLSSAKRLPADDSQTPKRTEGSQALSTISDPAPSYTTQTNPFSYDPGQQPPLHPSQRQEHSKAPSTHNPFVSRNKFASSRSEDGGSGKLPPLPPRKPPVPTPPPRHASVSSPPSSRTHPTTGFSPRTSVTAAPHPPPPPLKPKPATHVTSTLIKQSLQASKAAQTMKKAEEQLEKERVLQVLRSSAVVSGARSFAGATITHSSIAIGSNLRGAGGSRSPTKRGGPVAESDSSTGWSSEEREKPPLPRRRHQHQQQPSPPMSTSSLEQVALAVAPSGSKAHTPYSSSPFDSPDNSPHARASLELPGVAGLAPPTHPNRKSHGLPYQMSSVLTEEPSPFKRNLETFEAVYGNGQLSSTATSTTTSMDTPTTPTAADLSGSGSPSSRMYRSKSLHYHTAPPPPPPPVRRKRPESVQLLSNGEVLFKSKQPPTPNDSPLNNALRVPMSQDNALYRRSSLSEALNGNNTAGSSGGGSGADAIQRTLAGIQLRAESALPKLEAARYKAEAGLSRRGFIKAEGRSRSRPGREDREGLMNHRYGDDEYDDGDRGVGVDVDSGDEDGARGRLMREEVRERDEFKWPAGDGWKML